MVKKRSSNHKQSSTARRLANRPENVYKVVPKRSKKRAITPPIKNQHMLTGLLRKKLHTNWLIIAVLLTGFLAAIPVFRMAQSTVHMLDKADASSATATFDQDTLQRLYLIGQEKDYPTEIGNFQSAPADLRDFIITDYKNLKTNCIVNGAFISAPRYLVANVVSDSFARIEKSCNGADTLLLKKMSGTWTVIYAGNDLPKCSEVNAFSIPQGISYKCRDGIVTYTNPNP